MSKEAAVAFLKQVAENSELQKKLVAFAQQQGYDFTVEELTDSELGKVAGGVLNTYLKIEGTTLSGVKLSPELSSIQLNTDLSTFK